MNTDAKTQIIYNDAAVNIKAKNAVYNNANYIYVWADDLPLPEAPEDVVTVKVATMEDVMPSASGPDDPPLEWDYDEYYSVTISNAAPLYSTAVPKILEAVIIYFDAVGIHLIKDAPVTVNPTSLTVTVGDITSTGFELQDTQDGYLTAVTNFPGITAFGVQVYKKG